MAKPASGTALDTGHALYTNLAHAWGLLEGTGTTSVDSRGTKDLTLSSSGLWTTNGGGENIIRIGTATAAPLALATSLTLGGGSAHWSIAFRAKQATSNNEGMILGDNSNTNDFLWFSGGNYLRFRSSSGGDFDFSSLTTFTTTANYLITSSDGKIYKDGSLVQTLGAFTPTLNVTHLGNGYTSTTLALVGDIEYVYVWTNRTLNLTDAGTLHTDPYVIYQSAPASTPSKAADRRGQKSKLNFLSR